MEISECYEQFGGDYEGVLARMLSEERVAKFARKFLLDDNYYKLTKAVAEEHCEEAFRAVHTLKSICQNLGFVRLYGASSRLTEELRGHTEFRNPDRVSELMERINEEYDSIIAALSNLSEDA